MVSYRNFLLWRRNAFVTGIQPTSASASHFSFTHLRCPPTGHITLHPPCFRTYRSLFLREHTPSFLFLFVNISSSFQIQPSHRILPTPQTRLDASGFPEHLALVVSLLICWRARAVSCISDIFLSAWRKSSRRVCEMNGWMNEVDIVLYFLTWRRSQWARLIIHSWELWTMVEQKCCPPEKTLVGLILGCRSKSRLLSSCTTLKAQCWGVLPLKYTEGRLGP